MLYRAILLIVAGFLLAAFASFLASTINCSENRLIDIQSPADYQQEVRECKGVVLVDFYKDGCPPCVAQEAEMQPLVTEYAGRVKFVRMKIREFYMKSKCPEFMDQYNLFWAPTVILYVDGKEQQRWVFDVRSSAQLRASLNAALAGKSVHAPVTEPLLPLLGPTSQCTTEGCPLR